MARPSPRLTRDFARRELTIEQDFEAPRTKVWKAWTTVEKLVRWWGPRDWPATSHSFDFRVGGHWHFSMTGPGGETHWAKLRYTRVEPESLLEVDDHVSDQTGAELESFSRWSVSFLPRSANTTRVRTRVICSSEANLQRLIDLGFEAGYTSALANLNEVLTGRAEPHTVASADGTKLVYEKVGSGPALILVGGALVTRTNSSHTDLAAALVSHFTVYNYDRRGRGDSGNTKPYSVAREIEDLQAMIGVAGGEAAVYGMSSGAILALRAAISGVKMKALVLYEPPFIVEPGDRHPPADALEVVSRLVARGRNAAAVTYFMTQIFGMPAFVPWIIRLTPHWKPSVAAAPSLPHDLTIVGDYGLPGGTDGITIPTLVIHGRDTQPLLIHGAEAVARTIPQAELSVLPGVNHQIPVEHLAPAVLQFLKGEKS